MAKVRRHNPGVLLFGLISFSILISTASEMMIIPYLPILLITSLIFRVHLISCFKKSPILLMMAVFIAISEIAENGLDIIAFLEALRFLILLGFSLLFLETTDPIELSASIGSILSPVMGKKAWKLSSAVMITIAIIPIVFRSAQEMINARHSRGMRFLRHPIRNLTEYLESLMLLLFKKSENLALALEARGFSPARKRFTEKLSFLDIITLICIILLTALTVISRL